MTGCQQGPWSGQLSAGWNNGSRKARRRSCTCPTTGELLARTATHVVTLELGAAGNTAWVHGGGFASYHDARRDRFARLEELRRRWDEEHAKLKTLVTTLRQKAAYNDGMASRYRAAVTRLTKFEEAGPPQTVPQEQAVTMRLRGGRTGKRAVICSNSS